MTEAEFLRTRPILIADESASVIRSMAQVLVELGAEVRNIATASDLASAKQMLRDRKPGIIVAEYAFSDGPGLQLVGELKKICPRDTDRLFVLATSNSSESAVAEAAEEDCDGFILKPFNRGILKKAITRAIQEKLAPGSYQEEIQRGKDAFHEKKLAESVTSFSKAQELHEKPTLAYYYLGRVLELKDGLDQGRACFEKGLALNSLHFKCLGGMIDNHFRQRRYQESFQYLKKLFENFPTNPKRISQAIVLAIETSNFKVLETAAERFSVLEKPPHGLAIRLVLGLVIGARSLRSRGDEQQAQNLAFWADRIAGNDKKALWALIEYQLETEDLKAVDRLLDRFLLADQDTSECLASKLGRKLVGKDAGEIDVVASEILESDGFHPLEMRAVIRYVLHRGWNPQARELIDKAAARYPERKEEFLDLSP